MTSTSYDAAFAEMAARFRKDDWEARQETPPQSYLHVSKPNWKDQHMNGIHLETYVLGGQLKNGYAPVCLHCERGFPRQAAFMKSFTLKAKSRLEELGFTVKGPSGCSICELLVEIRGTPEATCAALEAQIRRLQELAPLIDETIAEVCA